MLAIFEGHVIICAFDRLIKSALNMKHLFCGRTLILIQLRFWISLQIYRLKLLLLINAIPLSVIDFCEHFRVERSHDWTEEFAPKFSLVRLSKTWSIFLRFEISPRLWKQTWYRDVVGQGTNSTLEDVGIFALAKYKLFMFFSICYLVFQSVGGGYRVQAFQKGHIFWFNLFYLTPFFAHQTRYDVFSLFYLVLLGFWVNDGGKTSFSWLNLLHSEEEFVVLPLDFSYTKFFLQLLGACLVCWGIGCQSWWLAL